jgi:hypothetical protein
MGLLGASFSAMGAIITYIVMTLREKERKIIPPPEDDFL